MGCPMKNLYLVLSGAAWAVRGHLLSPTIHHKCKDVMSYNNHGGGMGCPRIVLLNVYNCNVHRNCIVYSYVYMSSPVWGRRVN